MNNGRIDSAYNFEREQAKFPMLIITNSVDAIQILIEDLPKGNVNVCIKQDGQVYKTSHAIRKDLDTLGSLVSIQPFSYYETAKARGKINNITDLIDAKYIDWEDK